MCKVAQFCQCRFIVRFHAFIASVFVLFADHSAFSEAGWAVIPPADVVVSMPSIITGFIAFRCKLIALCADQGLSCSVLNVFVVA